jgi:glutamine synthetase
MYMQDAKAKRLEYRPPDPTAKSLPCLLGDAFSAMLQGRARRGSGTRSSRPTQLIETSTSSRPQGRSREARAGLAEGGVGPLEADHDILIEGGVSTDDLIETWLEYKRTKEVDQIGLLAAPLGAHALSRPLIESPS